MIAADLFRVAYSSLASHKTRTFLNLLGVVIAVTTIVSVISVVSGLNKYAADVFGQLGPNTTVFGKFVFIRSREEFLEAAKRKNFTEEDVEAVRRLVPQALRVTGRVISNHPVYAEGRRLPAAFVLGSGPELPWMVGMELSDGRYFTATEAAGARSVAVIGWDLKDQLFPLVDPIGRLISVGGKPFRVIGVLVRQGSAFGQNQDSVALIPLAAYHKVFGRQQSVDIMVESPDQASRGEVDDAVRVVLRSRRGTPFGAPDPFSKLDAEALQAFWRDFTFQAFALVILISAISLIVGGVAIANTMFASVVERTREIGIRKALGARRADLRRQFLIEAVTLSFAGGLLGILLGWLASLAVGAWSPFPARVTPGLIATGLGVGAFSGLLAGWLPAIRASRLDPIVALREE